VKRLVVAGIGLLGWAAAQGFYTPLENHPSVLQAKYTLEAALAQSRAVESPVNLNVQGGLGGSQLGPKDPICFQPPSPANALQQALLCGDLSDSQKSFSLSLGVMVFPYGDVGDAVVQARASIEQAKLGLNQARTQLQTQALESAYRVRLAQMGLEAARAAEKLAAAGLESAKLREARGAASPSEVRQAEAQLRQAQFQTTDAQRNVSLAQNTLADLLGSPGPVPGLPPLPRPQDPPTVLQAQFQLLQAQINIGKAERTVWPVLQANYTRYTSNTESWSIGLESRTLQPSLSFNYQDPNPSRTPPQDRIEATWRIGISANISFGVLDGLEAARKQLEAAQAALEAARKNSKLQEDSIKSSLMSAEQNLQISKQNLADTEKFLAEAKERERLGLASPLATLQAELNLAQARLGLEQANLSLLSRTLDLYRFYGIPLEVNQ